MDWARSWCKLYMIGFKMKEDAPSCVNEQKGRPNKATW